MPLKAIWNNIIIAESDNYKIVAGKYYFPPESVRTEYLQKNENQYISRWKGTANYYDIIIGDVVNKDAAWMFLEPEKEIEEIKGYFSFWNGVDIIKIENEEQS